MRTIIAKRPRRLLAVVICVGLCAASGSAVAQKVYDDHELEDRFYITIGGFQQDNIRTTISVNAKTPQGGLAAGGVIALESLFGVDNEVATVRLDGWYRFNKKNRINWTFWSTSREGLSTYSADEPIDIGDITISPGDSVFIEDRSKLFAVNYTFSFVNTKKFEAWLGGGLNFQSLETTFTSDVGGGGVQTLEEEAKATVPIPAFVFGLRWNFSRKTRMLVTQQLFGIDIGDFSGKLSNTRVLAEYSITKNFGIGGGFERFKFEVDAETDDFLGSLDTGYTGLSLYFKGQI